MRLRTRVDRADHVGVNVHTAWRWFVVGGGVLAVAHHVLPESLSRGMVHAAVGIAAVAAIVLGIRMHRPRVVLPWALLAAGTAAWAVGDVLWPVLEHLGQAPFPSVADVFYLAGYPLLAAGLYRMARAQNPGGDRTATLDAVVVAIVITLVMWVLFIEPAWTAPEGTLVSRALGAAYPVGDVLLIAQLSYLGAAATRRRGALRLLGAAMAVVLLADLLFQAEPYLEFMAAWTTTLDGLWLLGYVLIGAAGLHPSMARTTEPQGPTTRIRRLMTWQLIALGVVVTLLPGVLFVEVATGAVPHVAEVAVAAMLVIIVVHLRMVGMTRYMAAQADRLAALAEQDVLTGLANRDRFTAAVESTLDDPRGEPEVPVLLVVLDRFAEINDTLGHRVGDELLVASAGRMVDTVGEDGLIARLGGDSFGVLLTGPGTDPDTAVTRAETICAALAVPYELSDVTVTVDALVGLAIGPADGVSVNDLLQRADVALSMARDRPGHVARYSGRMDTRGTLAPHLMTELARAMADDEIVMYYQPQVQLGTGEVTGVEALVRWQHPEHGLLPPSAFIPAAERTGLIRQLTAHVLDKAAAQLARWRTEGLDLQVAVNLSARNLLDRDFVDVVRETLVRHQVPAAALELEITETMAMVDPNRSIEVLGALDRLGVRLAVDDYGTGYSSLAYLQRLPVQRLKIDRSFVSHLTSDEASAVIVRSTIDLARNLGLSVVAEGVEDDATLNTLRDMRCESAQGFGLGRPVPADQVPDLVRVIETRVPRALAQRVPAGIRMV